MMWGRMLRRLGRGALPLGGRYRDVKWNRVERYWTLCGLGKEGKGWDRENLCIMDGGGLLCLYTQEEVVLDGVQ